MKTFFHLWIVFILPLSLGQQWGNNVNIWPQLQFRENMAEYLLSVAHHIGFNQMHPDRSSCLEMAQCIMKQSHYFCGLVFMKTRRYGPLRGPTSSSCGGLWPLAEAFFALWAKKELFMLFWPIFGNFWCPVVTMVTFSSNHGNI